MISSDTTIALEALAAKIVSSLVALPHTQQLIIQKQHKLDRVDTKLLKEANKISKKEKSQVKCEGERPSKRKGSITYRSYSIDFKKKLISSLRQEIRDKKTNLTKLIRQKARQLKIHPKNINRWYHTKEIKKKQGGRKALYPEMEIRLANFILNNPTMRRKLILRQAKVIMQELQIPGRDSFSFSKGWYERFRERLNKSKIFAEVKLQNDQIKYEVKREHFDGNEDFIKKEEDDESDYYSDEESYVSDQSCNYSDEVRWQQELYQQELEEQKTRKYRSLCLPRKIPSRQDISIFFDEEDQEGEGNEAESFKHNSTILNILEKEEHRIAQLFGQS